ncbi:hypothetical protein R1sor_000664 [Riccia sorocarpa]|uniref:GCK domain-containing protein n=1 Tax=Riccia sorocarpa TaxID=122646 RepID=A0ABD3GWU7_9MARC
MAAESVKIEVIGISTEIGEDDQQNGISVVESDKSPKEFDLVAEDNREPATVVYKDEEFENREESSAQEDGAEHRSAKGGAKTSAEIPASGSEEEGEQEECAFCLFMKAGPCGEQFTVWQNCVEEAEKAGEDIVVKCTQTTSLLKACMDMNTEYYGLVLEAERVMASEDEKQAAGNPSDEEKTTEVGDMVVDEATNSEMVLDLNLPFVKVMHRFV